MSNEKVEEVSKKVAEEVQTLTEEVSEEVQAVAEEVEKFINVSKLKCNYTIYQEQRKKLKMPFAVKCGKCGKLFKNGDEIYLANTRKDNKKIDCIICQKCSKKL